MKADPNLLAKQYPYLNLTPQDFVNAISEDAKVRGYRATQQREHETIKALKAKIPICDQALAALSDQRKELLKQIHAIDGKMNTQKGAKKHLRRLINNALERIRTTEGKVERRHWSAYKALIRERLVAQGRQLSIRRLRAVGTEPEVDDIFALPEVPKPPKEGVNVAA